MVGGQQLNWRTPAIDMLFQRDNPITGVATGFFELDDMTSGLQKSD
jgi:replicative DNA helicase